MSPAGSLAWTKKTNVRPAVIVLGGVPLEIVGGGEETTLTLKFWTAVRPAVSVAVIVMVSVPSSLELGVQVTSPVVEFTEKFDMVGDVAYVYVILPP